MPIASLFRSRRRLLSAGLALALCAVSILRPSSALAQDTTPPTFAGVTLLTVDCAGLGLQLAWNAASDDVSSADFIRYRLYVPSFGTVGTPRSESVPGATAMTIPVSPGDSDTVLVRAVDEAGNEDANLRVLNFSMPSDCGPPGTDTTAPVFDGVSSVSAGPGPALSAVLSWDAAVDDVTVQEGIRYRLYLPSFGTVGTPQGTSVPGAASLEIPVTPGVTYSFLLRAVDTRGNEDSNLRILSFRIPDSTGVLPESSYAFRCESSLSKAVVKLANAITRCHRSQVQAGMKAEPFDAQDCEAGARTKYDQAVARVFETGECPPCAESNAPLLAERIESHLDENNGGAYCDGTVPIPQ